METSFLSEGNLIDLVYGFNLEKYTLDATHVGIQ